MEDLSKYTLIELNKLINEVGDEHETLKQEVINDTYEMDSIESKINIKINRLNELERNYIELIEEMNNKNAF